MTTSKLETQLRNDEAMPPTAHAATLMATRKLIALETQRAGLIAERDALLSENSELRAEIARLTKTLEDHHA